jgi:hypothetical protein
MLANAVSGSFDTIFLVTLREPASPRSLLIRSDTDQQIRQFGKCSCCDQVIRQTGRSGERYLHTIFQVPAWISQSHLSLRCDCPVAVCSQG